MSLIAIKNKPLVTLVRGPVVFKGGGVNNEATPAIAFAYIAGYLQNRGYRTALVDAIKEGLNFTWPIKWRSGFWCQGLTFDEIILRIPKESEVIGFSGMFSGEWPLLRELIYETRKHFPQSLLVAGGEHITAATAYSLRDCRALDVCILGEGEETFYQLLEAYSNTGDFTKVKGIGYLDKDGHYQQNGEIPSRIPDINKIPWPYWPEGYLEAFWRENKSYGISTERDMPFMFSRGCPYQCSFCSNTQMWTVKYSLRDINDVIDEIKHYLERFNISSIQLYDMTAIVNKKWIVEFCQRLISEKIELCWSLPSGTRSEALDKETLSLLKKSGCNYVVYAPESASRRTLKTTKKQVRLDKLTQSILEAKRLGLTTRVNLIIGFPQETWQDIFQTLFYALKMAVRGVDEVPVYLFSPYPGSEMFKELSKGGKITLNDDYFFKLTSLNSAYTSWDVISCNACINARTLGILRTIFVLLNYSISYILYPYRIMRTLKNLFTDGAAATVFEHRFKDMLKRKRIKGQSSLESINF